MKDFTTGREGPLILRFALPMLLGNVFMQTYQLVDSIIVGQYLGKEALAAVGASTPIIFMLVALIIGVSAGASVVISQYFGAKEYDRVRTACDTLFLFLLLMRAWYGFHDPSFGILTTTPPQPLRNKPFPSAITRSKRPFVSTRKKFMTRAVIKTA